MGNFIFCMNSNHMTITNTKNMTNDVLLGDDIDAVTTAVVLATFGHQVQIYSHKQRLQATLEKYSFEHQVMALWQLYVNKGCIEVSQLPQKIHTDDADMSVWQNICQSKVEAIWWFVNDTIQANQQLVNQQLVNQKKQAQHDAIDWTTNDWTDAMVTACNTSEHQSVAIVLSGKQPIGYFHQLSQQLHRPWVYYVPFVFLQDGQAYHSMLSPFLWLLGEKTPNSGQRVSSLTLLQNHAKQSEVADINTMEFARSGIMAMLATRVSYMNELSRLADAHKVDITRISHIMGLDSRIGASYLQAGWGFGGRTLPVEMQLIKQSFAQTHTDSRLITAVDAINEDQKELIFRKFWQYFDGLIDNKTVLIWGGSYKAGSGRTQNSAIHPLLRLLWSYDIQTLVYADKATEELRLTYLQSEQSEQSQPNQPQSVKPKLTLLQHPYERINDAHALFVISWDNAQAVQVARINDVAIPVFDAKNCFSTSQVAQLVGDYVGMGR